MTMQLLKQLLYVCVLAGGVFYLARPIVELNCSPADFKRRRNLWFLLTAVAFLSPSFWLWVLVAVVALLSASRKDDNPVAIYLLLLQVLPPIGISIPSPIELFLLDNYRVLAFAVLLPLVIKLRKQDPATVPNRALGLPDYLLLGFCLQQTIVFLPPDLPSHVIMQDSATNMLRRGLLVFLDVFLLHYAVSRGCADRRKLIDACMHLFVGFCIMSAIAVVESAKQWLLYDGVVSSRWDPTLSASTVYTMRGDSLRAVASAGVTLGLGVALAVGFGLWIALRPQLKTRAQQLGAAGLIWVGLLASYSRGPWLGAILMYVMFIVVSARSLGPIIKGAAAIGATLTLLLLSPAGDKIRAVMPIFGGTVDNFNVIYRKRLAARAWELIGQSPLFGDPLALTKMQDLRQGEGIIDMVNSFASITVFYGLVGVTLWFGYFLILTARALLRARSLATTDPALATFGYGLIGTIAGLLMMLYASSFINLPEKIYYIMGAFCSAYLAVKATSAQTVPASAAPPAARARHVKLRPWAPR
jgi:hypothetical protein